MKRRVPFVALAALLSAAPLTPARADAPAPALWEGVVRSPDGSPAAGATVVAWARPPAIARVTTTP